MRWGLSWGAQAPHHIDVMGTRYEVRTTRIAGVCTAYGTVSGVCIEATGATEREARQKWQTIVAAMTPLLTVERRVEQSLDQATTALQAAALEGAISDIAAAQAGTSQANRDAPAETTSAPPADPPTLHPETCEVRRSADRRLRPRLPREQ